MSGKKIIEGLKQAIAGDFARVTIGGQVWIRATELHADHQEIMRINNSLRETLLEVRKFLDENADHPDTDGMIAKIDAVARS